MNHYIATEQFFPPWTCIKQSFTANETCQHKQYPSRMTGLNFSSDWCMALLN